MANVSELIKDPDFRHLGVSDQRRLLSSLDPDFKGVSDQDITRLMQSSVMITPPKGAPGPPAKPQVQMSTNPVRQGLELGGELARQGINATGAGVKNVVRATGELGNEVIRQSGIPGVIEGVRKDPLGTAASVIGSVGSAINPGFDPVPGGDMGVTLTRPQQHEQAEDIASRGPTALAAQGVLAAGSVAGLNRMRGATLADVREAAAAPTRALNNAKPEVHLTRAFNVPKSNASFPDTAVETAALVKKYNGGANARNFKEAVPMLQKTANEFNKSLEPYFQRADTAGVKGSGDPVIQATQDYLNSHTNPSQKPKADLIMDQARMDYNRDFTPRELKAQLEKLNKDLYSVFNQNDARQNASLSDIPTGVMMAQRDAIANHLYQMLAPEESGAGPRYIQTHLGNVLDMLRYAQDQVVPSLKQTPASTMEGLQRAVTGAIGAPVRALRTVGNSPLEEAFTGNANVQLKKGFKHVRHEPNVLPQPASPDYQYYANPAPTTAKQLPAGKAPFTQGTVVPDIAGSPKGPGTPETRIERMLPPGRPDMGEGVIQVPPAGASRTKLTGPDQTSFSQIPLSPRTAAAPADTSGGKLIPGKAAVPQGDPSVIPPGQTQRMIDMQTQPAPSGAKADAEWWAKQPPTQPEIHERYKQLFNKAENLSPQKPVQIPSTGPGEEYTRGLDAHHNVAKQVLDPGKDLDSASPQERSVIDQLVNEGYGYAAPPKPFAKGGIITKPTLGLIGEDGPEIRVPLTAAQPTTPEKPGTIQIQLSQLEQGKRKVVMIPRGTNTPKKPKGMKEYQDASGNRYIFNPSQISHRDIDSAATENRLPDILGAKDGGMGAPDKSQLGPGTQAVVGETKDGTETQSTAADPAHLDKAIQQTKKVTPKDGLLDVRPVEEQLAKRKEPTDSDLKSPEPVDKAVDKIRGSINVPLDDQGHKEADELGQSFAAKGGVQRIISSPLLRAKQTDQGITKHNPTARVIITQNLRPWPLGALEGSPTEQALPELKRLALQAPAEIPKGIGKGSTEAGQSFNRFSRRVLSEVRRQLIEHAKTAPQEVWDLSVHKSILNLIHAWAKKGARPTYEIDRNSFFANGTDPASVYHISDDGRTIMQVDMKAKGRLPGGLYASRHGSTSFNAPSSAAGPGKSVS